LGAQAEWQPEQAAPANGQADGTTLIFSFIWFPSELRGSLQKDPLAERVMMKGVIRL
jgi:hypothetical protein